MMPVVARAERAGAMRVKSGEVAHNLHPAVGRGSRCDRREPDGTRTLGICKRPHQGGESVTKTGTTDFAKMREDLRLARVDPPAQTEWSVWDCDEKGRPDNPLRTHQTEEMALKAAETRRFAGSTQMRV